LFLSSSSEKIKKEEEKEGRRGDGKKKGILFCLKKWIQYLSISIYT
jgi:hypothetical protein